MEIYNFPQYSDEWWAIREKRMTASHATAVGNCGKGLITYIRDLMRGGYSKTEEDRYSNKHLERGLELEDSAGMVYSFENNIEIKKVGFVVYSDYVGCSPDLFAGDDGLCEIKCHDDKEHFNLLLGDDFQSNYLWQVYMQMLICEKKWTDLVSYNPNFTQYLIVRRILPDQKKFDQLLKGFKMGEEMIRAIERRME